MIARRIERMLWLVISRRNSICSSFCVNLLPVLSSLSDFPFFVLILIAWFAIVVVGSGSSCSSWFGGLPCILFLVSVHIALIFLSLVVYLLVETMV